MNSTSLQLLLSLCDGELVSSRAMLDRLCETLSGHLAVSL